jgi:transposase
MFVRKKITKNNPNAYVQLVESYRKDGKMHQKIIKHIGSASTKDQLEQVSDLANKIKELYLSGADDKIIEAYRAQEISKIHSTKSLFLNCKPIKKISIGMADIYGTVFDDMQLNTIIKSRSNYSNILKDLVVGKIACLGSKKKICEQLEQKFDKHYNLNSIYRTMDKISDEEINIIQNKICEYNKSLLGGILKVLFYDATTIYFESFKDDELKKLGYSKDLKFSQPQLVFTLLLTDDGLPLAYQLFPGNTYEGNTLIAAINFWKKAYPEQKITLIADSGMLNDLNINYLESEGFNYIVCARLKSLKKQLKEQILECKEHTNEEFFYNIHMKHRRLIISYRENRAIKDRHDREKTIEKLQNKLKKSSSPSSLINNYGYKKYITVSNDSDIELNQEKIIESEKWDGLHGIITNITDQSAEEIYGYYRNLWQIEDAFRINKTDLKIRPIFHWTPNRIKSHIAISYIAYCCYKAVEFKINSMSDEKLSHRVIREILEEIQVAIYEDKYNKEKFCMPIPHPFQPKAEKIYKYFGLTLNNEPHRYIV